MRATFLAHSGFLVELPSVTLLFDWWKGELPPLREDVPLLVFASHRHEDHFNPEIFSLPAARFLLGKDIKLSSRNLERWSIPPETAEKCLTLGGGETVSPLPGVTVETLPSTDEGAAFLVTADGKTIYHAGDLHWWHWEGEDKGWNRNMEVSFKRYTEPLRDRRLDLAMVPLDPRLKDAYGWGLRYFLELTDAQCVLPMHQWENFALTDRFRRDFPELAQRITPVTREGECFDLA